MFQRRRRDQAVEQTVRQQIAQQEPSRWAGTTGPLGGLDEPGFSIGAMESGQIKVLIGTDQGEKIGFVMEADVARRFFERGVALVNASDTLTFAKITEQN